MAIELRKIDGSDESEKDQGAPSPKGETLIFISHDTRDAQLAEAFSKLLTSVSAGVLKSFRSSDRKGTQGIEYGVEWYPELMKKLKCASDVVCLLTERSIGRPWLLYEAGVAKGKLDTPVHGIALGIPLSGANTGPFAQFQNCDDDPDSLTKLVMQLLNRIPGSEPDLEAVELQVDAFKKKVDSILPAIGSEKETRSKKPAVDESSIAKLFEEVKVMFQDLPSRIDGMANQSQDGDERRRLRRVHPRSLEGILQFCHYAGNPLLSILIVVSIIKDDIPWIYELGVDLYRAARSGKAVVTEEALTAFQQAVEMLERTPIAREVGLHRRELTFLLHDANGFVEHVVRNHMEERRISGEATRQTNKKASTEGRS